jgi:hypothetical protein
MSNFLRASWFRISCGLLLGAALVWIGAYIGAKREHQQFELLIDSAPVLADQYAKAGNLKKAISALFLAKAYEPMEGVTDGELAKLYLLSSKPCLAESHFRENIQYMDRNLLKELPSYSSNMDLLSRARDECAKLVSK